MSAAKEVENCPANSGAWLAVVLGGDRWTRDASLKRAASTRPDGRKRERRVLPTLELLESLITDPDVRHVSLIEAYRDNEVFLSPPLMGTLSAIRKREAKTQKNRAGPSEA
jgi:hypothetical protein